MYIMSQDRKKIVNADNILEIYLEEIPGIKPYIKCVLTDKKEVRLGIYESEERCMEILKEIPMFFDKKLYEMPKE